MPNRIVFATNKGGTGKTTSTAMCAKILSAAGYRVLSIDMDSQGNLTRILTGHSIYKYTDNTIMEAIKEGDVEPYIINVGANLDLIPAEDRLSGFSRYIYTAKIGNPYAVLKRLIQPIENRYDFVFVDIGPSLGDESINAIVYADKIVVPVDCGDLAMDALLRFQEFVEASNEKGHTNAEIFGILMTMRDRRSNYEKDVSDGIRSLFGSLVFTTEIRRRVKVKEMSAKGVDVEDPAMEDYLTMVEELIGRLERKENNDGK